MSTRMYQKAFCTFLTCLGLSTTPGCMPQAMPKEFGVIAKAVAASTLDQAVWESLLAEVEGHVNNPGVRLEAGLVYFAEAKLVGVDGEVEVAGAGHGDEAPSPEAEQVIRDLLQDKPEVIDQLLDFLKSKLSPTPDPAPATPAKSSLPAANPSNPVPTTAVSRRAVTKPSIPEVADNQKRLIAFRQWLADQPYPGDGRF